MRSAAETLEWALIRLSDDVFLVSGKYPIEVTLPKSAYDILAVEFGLRYNKMIGLVLEVVIPGGHCLTIKRAEK